MQKNSKLEDTIKNLVLPHIEHAGFELVDLEYRKEGNDWILRLFIDHEEGIDLDDCQLISTIVGDELDKSDPIPHTYILEVSSPGVERPLKILKDFEKFQGEKIKINLYQAKNGKKDFIGQLLGLENNQVALEWENTKVLFNLDEIAKAHLIFDFK